jgi:aspartyl/glutamyl-tRNA(Asn/Gln) amidotransferase C subunit
MATVEEVKKLAALVRIEIDPADLESFTKDFDAILAYVGQLESLNLPTDVSGEKPALRNVMRTEGEPHESGKYTEALAAQFPAKEGDALAVKQIITHD